MNTLRTFTETDHEYYPHTAGDSPKIASDIVFASLPDRSFDLIADETGAYIIEHEANLGRTGHYHLSCTQAAAEHVLTYLNVDHFNHATLLALGFEYHSPLT